MKELKGDRSANEKNVTIKELHGMSDVVDEVDRLMDKKFSLKSFASSESDKESRFSYSSSLSSSASSSESDDCQNGSRRKKSSQKRRKRGHRSGKNRNSSSYVKYPQRWANTQLALHFACSKEKKLEELSIPEFCAGFLTILETSSKGKMSFRMAHLKELMYLATKYQWRNVLSYHAACLTEIERGHLTWGDNFQMLQNTTLAGAILQSSNKGSSSCFGARSTSGSGGSGSSREEGTIFCRFFQRGTCSQSDDHMGFFNGERRMLKHICAKCWLDQRRIERHPENSADCPSK